MTASTSMSVFHQWLLADPASQASACAIVLHGKESDSTDPLLREITDYLNEYDDDGDGRWLPATEELVKKIEHDPSDRRLLGMPETGSSNPDSSRTEFMKTLTALGQRSLVVFRSPGIPTQDLKLANTFHAFPARTRRPRYLCLRGLL